MSSESISSSLERKSWDSLNITAMCFIYFIKLVLCLYSTFFLTCNAVARRQLLRNIFCPFTNTKYRILDWLFCGRAVAFASKGKVDTCMINNERLSHIAWSCLWPIRAFWFWCRFSHCGLRRVSMSHFSRTPPDARSPKRTYPPRCTLWRIFYFFLISIDIIHF